MPPFEVHEAGFNPDHQGFIGFIPPSDHEAGKMRDVKKTARRIAADLVLMPRSMRGDSEYPEEYLKKVSGCRVWPRLMCAHCDCHKSEDEE